MRCDKYLLVHCCTRLSVGMMLRLGTGCEPPIRGSVFFGQLPRSYFGHFLQKAPDTLRNVWSKFYYDPLKSSGFLVRSHFSRIQRHFTKLRGKTWQRPSFHLTWEWSFPFSIGKKRPKFRNSAWFYSKRWSSATEVQN